MSTSRGYTQPGSFWGRNPTAEREAEKMWNSGASAGMIAKELSKGFGIVSRNAVISKLSRMGHLTKRITVYNTKRTHQLGSRGLQLDAPRKKVIRRRLLAEPDVMPELPATGLSELSYERPATAVSIYQHKEHQCRWPVGHAKELLFCGAPVPPHSGLSYCPHHFRRSMSQHREGTNEGRPNYSIPR